MKIYKRAYSNDVTTQKLKKELYIYISSNVSFGNLERKKIQ